jgi:hypothetical protein
MMRPSTSPSFILGLPTNARSSIVMTPVTVGVFVPPGPPVGTRPTSSAVAAAPSTMPTPVMDSAPARPERVQIGRPRRTSRNATIPPATIATDAARVTTVMRNGAVLAGRARSYGRSCALKAEIHAATTTGINQNQARRRPPAQANESVPITPNTAATDVKIGGRFRTMRSSPEAGPYTPIRYAKK